MSDILTELRKPSTTNAASGLKRSKSVRASLRLIGNRFLHHKNQENRENMHKSPSLQNLNENKREFKRNYFNGEHVRKEYAMLPDMYGKQPVETILKTPMVDPRECKSQRVVVSHAPSEHEALSHAREVTPHGIIAPKAAALLQIPIQGNHKDACFRKDLHAEHQSWFLHRNGKGYDLEGRFSELEPGCRANGGFHRTSLRLSMISKKRTGTWNTTFSSTSSRFVRS